MDKEKEIEEMAKELHCATNESFVSCRKIARILVEKRGYCLCGSEDCPNFKHYQAECKRCTKKMEVKKSFEIESAVQQAVKEFAEILKGRINKLIGTPCVGMTERQKWVSEGQKDALCDCLSMVDEIFEEGKV